MSFHAGEATFDAGEIDTVAFMAYNILPGTTSTRVNNALPSWKLAGFEGSYYNGVDRILVPIQAVCWLVERSHGRPLSVSSIKRPRPDLPLLLL